MNAFQLKILAVVSMVIDHVGVFFFPKYFVFRIIGRLAFPLFAWFIANGARYTGNVKIYFLRLLALALLAQIPFGYAIHLADIPKFFNVVFTLCLGLAAIVVMQRVSNRWLWGIAAFSCAALAAMFNTDYGAEGVLSIAAFYVFGNDFRKMAVSQAVVTGILPFVIFVLQSKGIIDLSRIYLSSSIECVGLLSLIAIYYYDNKPGMRAKYLFYGVYFFQFVAIVAVFQLQLYGKPYHSVVRMFPSPNISLLFIGNPQNDAGKCSKENKMVTEALRQKCPGCAVTLSECRRKLYSTWEDAIRDKSDQFYTVRTDTSHVMIEADKSIAFEICREMVKQIDAQKGMHAECIPPRSGV